jgi:hypothetical protein
MIEERPQHPPPVEPPEEPPAYEPLPTRDIEEGDLSPQREAADE